MQTKFEMMSKGDSILNTWEDKIAIKRKNGDVEIFTFTFDENNLPRLSKDTILITFGSGIATIVNENSGVEIGTF